jgi:hypothetical protein
MIKRECCQCGAGALARESRSDGRDSHALWEKHDFSRVGERSNKIGFSR